ncbi:hypothetical protein CDV52_13965 [Haematobacter missouriensis]|uniref:Magnesium transporter MgtE intracellular domain-containing protein n=2 Tax=Haematobacter missouriensis TaxID=366616 RepID=A0A212AM02_9RHOB|nr:hypothetical protein CDV53_16505 [Haematobacter missouriensis]OWJ82509.1 hypothetical protein CDV52_13965 [Haematobacter missouriensis]
MRRPGPLSLVAVMFFASAAIRLAGWGGSALALEASPAMVETSCAALPGAAELLANLRDREARVAETERTLTARKEALDRAEMDIRQQLARLEAAEESLDGRIAASRQASEADLARLTAVYEAMKPKEAALLFEEMEPDFAAGFLARMRPEAAASLMAGLNPRTAYSFSVLLAGRNALAPVK